MSEGHAQRTTRRRTTIFSTEFALRLMGDVQQYFIDKKVRNFYSVSISGYHIAEAGANPISPGFRRRSPVLANGFTYVEYYLSRGMDINPPYGGPNLSFPAEAGFRRASTYFSNGMDPEPCLREALRQAGALVMGRVAMPSRRRFGRQARLRIFDRRTAQPDARVPLRASNGRHER